MLEARMVNRLRVAMCDYGRAHAMPNRGGFMERSSAGPGSLSRFALLVAFIFFSAGAAADPARAAAERLVADYIGLYTGPTLARWRGLFHPAEVVAQPDADGRTR